ncbi:S8 family peptidase [Staphylococcus felis]|uniref:S8 family peptidase n=1 Tax=Staphylococcus felis TaxID=46127 RepID=UPI0015DA7952|nr:S8 family serine peptidase [Staphylococcus felis]
MIDINLYNWDLKKITNNYETHKIELGNPKVKIAVIDSGADFTHPGLSKNLNFKKNYIDESDYEDLSGHGTSVCGQIVGNDKIKGIAPRCQVDIIKVLDRNNKTTFKTLIKSLEYILNSKYDIVNLSLGMQFDESEVAIKYGLELLKKIRKNGTIVVSSVGYGYENDKHFPSLSEDVLTVQSMSIKNTIVNEKLFANYCLPAGNHLNLKLEQSFDIDFDLVVAYLPLNLSFKYREIYNEFKEIPIGYCFSVGESLAAAKLSGIVAIIFSRFLKRYNRKPKINEVIYLLNKYSVVIKRRKKPELLTILQNI